VSELATLDVVTRGSVVRAALAGELDMSNAADLEAAIVDVVPNEATGMVLDLSAVTYLDSAGIRLLLTLVGRFRWRGQRLALVAPPGSRVRRVIELAGAQDALAVDEDEGMAFARLGRDAQRPPSAPSDRGPV
jgi:anti-sigma B factor antagonist